MTCKHERIKSVNCRIFCDICGEELPVDYLTANNTHAKQSAAETPTEPQKTATKTTRRKKV